MDLQPIKNETDYQAALQEIEILFNAETHTPEGEKLESLVALVEAYEEQNYPIEPPTSIEAIFYYLESRHKGVSLINDGLK